jgi:hypothetical protein
MDDKNKEVDYEKVLADKDAEIAKLTSDRDNYRTATLSMKGKLPVDDNGNPTAEAVEQLIERKVEEKYLEGTLAKANQEKDEIIRRQSAELKEVKVALASRPSVISASAGGSQPQDIPATEFWTADQERTFEEISKNLANIGVKKSVADLKEEARKNFLQIKGK